MKTVQYSASEGLVFVDVPMPTLEKDQVLIRVINTGFCGSDHSLVKNRGLMMGPSWGTRSVVL